MKRATMISMALLAAMLVAVGCGGDDDEGAVTPAESATEELAPADLTDPELEGDDLGAVEQTEENCPGAESPPNITNVVAYNDLECSVVEAAMDELKGISKKFEIGDFGCGRISGGKFGGVWECADFDGRRFTFDFGD